MIADYYLIKKENLSNKDIYSIEKIVLLLFRWWHIKVFILYFRFYFFSSTIWNTNLMFLQSYAWIIGAFVSWITIIF
jgi:NCS1 family nucleobase:cation symporter-1